ncbi:MAG TPA: cardiolipin synthase [Clostridia bacterium]|nr:cardiolipin synthase [Clostridia bacterium]
MNLIKKFFSHRVAFIFVPMILQLAFLISIIKRFNEYFVFFYGASVLLSLVVVLWIINNRDKPAYKIAWIIPILLFPIFGGLFYLIFGGDKLGKNLKKKMKLVVDKTKEVLEPRDDILEEIGLQDQCALNQSRYIQNNGYYPPQCNTETQYLPLGEVKFAKLLEELSKAKRYIFLEYFIIEEGLMWNSILEILVEKAAQGVDVRLIYDDAGCLFTLPYGYNKKLEKMGIKCCIFNPLVPLLSPRLNNRNHRKIAVIDGCVGFTGGINLADEYINKIEKYGHWKDTAIMLKGEAVWNMTVMFLTMWCYLRGTDEDITKFKADYSSNKISPGYVQPFADSPLDDEPVSETVYLNLINKAKSYVYITTPYLVIDNEMERALSSAAKAGVDVRIITPHIPDKWYVHEVTKSFYKNLVESGVKIYEYIPGFIHAKTFVVDDVYGVVGTINLDYRSLFTHFECGVWMYKTSSVKEIKEDFLTTLDVCKEILWEDFKNIKWYQTLTSSLLRIFSPLM